MATSDETVEFHFVKSTAFRVVHVDGAWCGMTPQGLINLLVYSERFPIPTSVTNKLTGGTLAEEIARTGRSGVVREVEVNMMMSIQSAKAMHELLGRHVAELQRLIDEAQTQVKE